MTPKQKTLWLEALRSGNYAQGHGALKQIAEAMLPAVVYEYCCLGVAKEVCNIESEKPIKHYGYLATTKDGDAETSWRERTVFLSAEVQIELSSKNDGGATFVQIADYIEKFIKPDEEEYLP